MKTKLTWLQKLQQGKPHYVKTLDKNFAGMKAGQQMLVPSAKLLDAFIQKIPKGKSVDVLGMREKLASKHKADVTCPIATGFVMKIVAEAAFEQLNAGEPLKNITPIWRVLDKDSKTLSKLTFDTDFIFAQRKREKLD